MNKWQVHRPGLRYVLEQRLWSDAFGSAYRYLRDEHGRVVRWWTKKAAQRVADALNDEED